MILIKDLNNMKKNRIKLTESQLHRVIKESVKKVLKEAYNATSIDTEDKITSGGEQKRMFNWLY